MVLSAKGRIQDRYTSAEQIVILPVNDMGQSLDAPMIVVTPPSPQDTPAENTSLRSESSIGTAEDLIPNSVETEAKVAEGDIDRENRVRDSMRNVLPSICPPESEDNIGLKKVQFTSRTDSQVNDFVSAMEDELLTVNDGNGVAGQTLSQTVIMSDGCHITINDNHIRQEVFNEGQGSSQLKLSSATPETKIPASSVVQQ